MSDVTIDRLVFELPGLDAATARALALGLAEGLAGARIAGHHQTLSIVVDPAQTVAPDHLAAHIVRTLLRRIG